MAGETPTMEAGGVPTLGTETLIMEVAGTAEAYMVAVTMQVVAPITRIMVLGHQEAAKTA